MLFLIPSSFFILEEFVFIVGSHGGNMKSALGEGECCRYHQPFNEIISSVL